MSTRDDTLPAFPAAGTEELPVVEEHPEGGVLVVEGGERRVVPLEPGRMVIGSGPAADLQVEGRGVEGAHLVLEVRPGGIRAQASALVFRNGRPLVEGELRSGDRLRLGTVVLCYVARGDVVRLRGQAAGRPGLFWWVTSGWALGYLAALVVVVAGVAGPAAAGGEAAARLGALRGGGQTIGERTDEPPGGGADEERGATVAQPDAGPLGVEAAGAEKSFPVEGAPGPREAVPAAADETGWARLPGNRAPAGSEPPAQVVATAGDARASDQPRSPHTAEAGGEASVEARRSSRAAAEEGGASVGRRQAPAETNAAVPAGTTRPSPAAGRTVAASAGGREAPPAAAATGARPAGGWRSSPAGAAAATRERMLASRAEQRTRASAPAAGRAAPPAVAATRIGARAGVASADRLERMWAAWDAGALDELAAAGWGATDREVRRLALLAERFARALEEARGARGVAAVPALERALGIAEEVGRDAPLVQEVRRTLAGHHRAAARRAAEQGDWRGAVHHCEQALAVLPHDAEARTLRAQLATRARAIYLESYALQHLDPAGALRLAEVAALVAMPGDPEREKATALAARLREEVGGSPGGGRL